MRFLSVIWAAYAGYHPLASSTSRVLATVLSKGGRASDGTLLYVIEAPYKDAVHLGKACESKEGMWFKLLTIIIIIIWGAVATD